MIHLAAGWKGREIWIEEHWAGLFDAVLRAVARLHLRAATRRRAPRYGNVVVRCIAVGGR